MPSQKLLQLTGQLSETVNSLCSLNTVDSPHGLKGITIEEGEHTSRYSPHGRLIVQMPWSHVAKLQFLSHPTRSCLRINVGKQLEHSIHSIGEALEGLATIHILCQVEAAERATPTL